MEKTIVVDAGKPTKRSINCDGNNFQINITNIVDKNIPEEVCKLNGSCLPRDDKEEQFKSKDQTTRDSSQSNNEANKIADDLHIKSENSNTCTFFATQRGCKYGDSCPFKHYRSINDAGEESSEKEEKHLDNQNGSKVTKSEVGMESQQTSSNKERLVTVEAKGKNAKKKTNNNYSKTVCRFSKQESGCQKSKCPFYHPENSGMVSQSQLSPTMHSGRSVYETSESIQKTNPIQVDQVELKSDVDIAQDIIESGHDETKLKVKRSNVGEEKNIKEVLKENKSKNIENKELIKGKFKKKNKRPCKFYLSSKGCKFENCSFLHQDLEPQLPKDEESSMIAKNDEQMSPLVIKSSVEGDETSNASKEKETVEQNKKVESQNICPYFSSKHSCFAKNCQDLHVTEGDSQKPEYSSNGEKNYENDPKKQNCQYYNTTRGCFKGRKCPYQHAKIQKDIQNVNSDQKSLQDNEFKQLETRFKAGNKFTLINKEPIRIYHVVISPTDPEWSFIVKDFTVRVEFPESYPEVIFSVELVNEETYPEGFTKSFNIELSKWTEERKSLRKGHDLDFRPFLRWFDKNLILIFRKAATTVKKLRDAKASGIQLIPHEDILPGKVNKEIRDDKTEMQDDTVTLVPSDSALPTEEANDLFEEADTGALQQRSQPSERIKKGTEVKFTHLSLNDNIGTMQLKHVKLTLECSRCKTRSDMQLVEKRTTESVCAKCNTTQTVTFHPELIHQHSAVAGYLQMHGCNPFDLILNDSIIILNCLNCSKDNTLKGMSYGTKEHWCHSCHKKMDLTIQASKFHRGQVRGDRSVNGNAFSKTPSSTRKKTNKDLSIKKGEELPDKGTCKHYKKSFRWLRFPCCGKIYPCDICHEEQTEDGHEMKFATRMICGHCSKEQPFSKEKACIQCQSNLTKGKSAHWEGGKGCRDRSKMSKNDRQKTAGLGKIVSRNKTDSGKK